MADFTFKKLKIEDVPALIPFFRLRPTKICDATIFDSVLWAEPYDAHYCILDDRALAWRWGSDDEAIFTVPQCTAEDLPHYFDELVHYQNEVLGVKARVYGVDEEALKIIDPDPDRFMIGNRDDYSDYVYDAELLRTLPGKKYHKKKNHINAFLKEYGDRWEYRALSPDDSDAILSFLERWEASKSDTDDQEHLKMEYQGLKDTLANGFIPMSDARIAGIFIDGTLEAFTIGTLQPDIKMAIIHIEKANPDIRGLYPLINREFLVHGFPEAVLVNREDDLGLPGLRKAKQSYYPVEMIKKLAIVEK